MCHMIYSLNISIALKVKAVLINHFQLMVVYTTSCIGMSILRNSNDKLRQNRDRHIGRCSSRGGQSVELMFRACLGYPVTPPSEGWSHGEGLLVERATQS